MKIQKLFTRALFGVFAFIIFGAPIGGTGNATPTVGREASLCPQVKASDPLIPRFGTTQPGGCCIMADGQRGHLEPHGRNASYLVCKPGLLVQPAGEQPTYSPR